MAKILREESWDLRRLAVTQTPVKDHKLTRNYKKLSRNYNNYINTLGEIKMDYPTLVRSRDVVALKKKKQYQQVEFVVPADDRIKGNWKTQEISGPCLITKNVWEFEGDSNTTHIRGTRNNTEESKIENGGIKIWGRTETVQTTALLKLAILVRWNQSFLSHWTKCNDIAINHWTMVL